MPATGFSSYLRDMRNIKRGFGKPLFAQVLEVLALRLGHTKLGPSEYMLYGLFDQSLSKEEKRAFVSWRQARRIDSALNSDSWRAVANDKLLFYSTLDALEINYPKIHAVFSHPPRKFFSAECLSSEREIIEYLGRRCPVPCFVKPIHGTFGRGAFSVVAIDSLSGDMTLGDGTQRDIESVAHLMSSAWAHGYLIQSLVKPHAAIENTCGNRVSSVRIIVLLHEEGPILFRCVWKIPTGRNMSDNFMHGDSGNLLGDVDPRSGEVKRAIRGTGAKLREVEFHPDTGQRLAGQRLPCWTRIRELVDRGATAYPGLRMQHWDVAFGADGPVVFEVNVEGSLDLHQLATGRGIRDAELESMLRK